MITPNEQQLPAHLDYDALLAATSALHNTKACDIWVVMDKKMRRYANNPGLNKPWSTKIRKLAENYAKEHGGIAVPLDVAIKKCIEHERDKVRKGR